MPHDTIAQYWPHHAPIYDINKSYAENASDGPFLPADLAIPERVWAPKEKWIDFLGYKIASPLGVPAGPLLNSRWTDFAARVGFDVVTYKTIRSSANPGHPLPNILYIDTDGDLTRPRWGETLKSSEQKPKDINAVAITNSFGMPSKDEAFLHDDIAKAQRGMREGQLLIVSVVGSAHDKAEFVDDFVKTAQLAVRAGAKVIEANFSCPNVVTGEGKIYSNPDQVYDIASKMVRALGDVPLLIKVGVFDEPHQMKDVIKAAARAKVKGICGINTLSMKVLDEQGQPALGATRAYSGICGGPIRAAAIDWVREASAVIRDERLDLALVGCGGIMLPEHFDEFLRAGANVATSATGMMWDPFLALRYHQMHAQNA